MFMEVFTYYFSHLMKNLNSEKIKDFPKIAQLFNNQVKTNIDQFCLTNI